MEEIFQNLGPKEKGLLELFSEFLEKNPPPETKPETNGELDTFLVKVCEEQFGPDGAISKEWAEEKGGNEAFAAFMKELEQVPDSNPRKAQLVERATQRRYHDYEGDLMKFGLVKDLYAAGLEDLADRVKEDEFDF